METEAQWDLVVEYGFSGAAFAVAGIIVAMDLVDLIFENRNAIKAICEKREATAVRIFGSCARDDYDEKSDIDILVEGLKLDTGWGGLGPLYDIEDELIKLLGRKVDVWTSELLKPKIRERALKEAVSL